MSEAQQMVSEFGETLGTLETEEEMDSILPCSATLYLTSNNSIHTQLIVHLTLFFVSYIKVLSLLSVMVSSESSSPHQLLIIFSVLSKKPNRKGSQPHT